MKHLKKIMAFVVSAIMVASFAGCVSDDAPVSEVTTEETTTVPEETTAVTEATTIVTEPPRDPEEFYKNYEPLRKNLFSGNEIIAEESEYKKQIDAIDDELEFLYGKDYNPSTESKLLLDALLGNENITLEDKMRLFPMIKYFNDNPHMNKQEYYDRLLNLKIIHMNDVDVYGAAYFPAIYTIELYNNDDSICHEFFHFTVPETSNDIGDFMHEGITLILNDEYFSRVLNTYEMTDNRVYYIKMLMETIGTDKVLEAYSKNDWRIIETELLKINPDSSIPNRIRELMDKYTEIFVANNFDRIIANREAESVKNELAEIMIDYYETKYPNNEESVFYVYDARFMQRANWKFRKTYKVYFNKERIGEDNEKIIYGS